MSEITNGNVWENLNKLGKSLEKRKPADSNVLCNGQIDHQNHTYDFTLKIDPTSNELTLYLNGRAYNNHFTKSELEIVSRIVDYYRRPSMLLKEAMKEEKTNNNIDYQTRAHEIYAFSKVVPIHFEVGILSSGTAFRNNVSKFWHELEFQTASDKEFHLRKRVYDDSDSIRFYYGGKEVNIYTHKELQSALNEIYLEMKKVYDMKVAQKNMADYKSYAIQ